MIRNSCRPWILLSILTLPLCVSTQRLLAQAEARTTRDKDSYDISLPVDEVELTFHAADASGLPVNDLKLEELRLLDDGKPPQRILGFYLLSDHPIRAGILIDTSESMDPNLEVNRQIAAQYTLHLLRQQTDQAFVSAFGSISKVTQSWTSDPKALSFGLQRAKAGGVNPLGGTALFDTLFRTCLYEFGAVDHTASGNFILLFSDGEDNASHTSVQEAVDACQHADTAIYAFHSRQQSGSFSLGPANLTELASKTGGRVFRSDDSQAGIAEDLHSIETDLRTQYRLVFKPAQLRHDHSFHSIDLLTPERVKTVTVRSGYYSPMR